MRVLLASSSSGSRGGGELYLLYLARALKRLGHTPVLWCSSHPRMDELAEMFAPMGQVVRDDYPNSYLDRPARSLGAALDYRQTAALQESFRRVAPDVIHVNKQTLEDGLDLLAAAASTDLPLLCTIHITQDNRSLGAKIAWPRDLLAKYRLRQSNAKFVAVSDKRAIALNQFLESEDVETVYTGVEITVPLNKVALRHSLLQDLDWPEDSIVFAYQARLVAQKNPIRFLKLARKLLDRDGRCRFLWIGDGDMKSAFTTNARQNNLEDHVHVTGWTTTPINYLACADIYLHPATYEGLPLSILEALALGLPCILSKHIADEVRLFHPDNILYCDSESDAWMNSALDEQGRIALGLSAVRLYQNHFTLEHLGRNYVKLYESL